MTKTLNAAPAAVIQVMNEAQLVQCEDTIRRGKDAFIEVGIALMQIRDHRGYQIRGYKTFEEYSEKVWGFSDRHARRLMSGAETAETVKKLTGETPANEAVARELAGIANDPKKIEKVAAKLKTKGGSLGTATAERVAQAVASVAGKAKAEDHAAPRKAEPPPPPPAFTDECPACGQVPQSYLRTDSGWHCGACDMPVYLGVVSATAEPRCKVCDQRVPVNAPYCPNCGAEIEV